MAIDPRFFANIPFRNPTAWTDFLGTFDLWHRALAQQVFLTTGNVYRVYPLGDGGGEEWLAAVQATYVGAAKALGLPPPPDLQSYDLSQPGDFASWTFIVSEASRSLRAAAGLN